jgi:hypothetical protein
VDYLLKAKQFKQNMEEAQKLFLGRWSTQALTTAISLGILDAISE